MHKFILLSFLCMASVLSSRYQPRPYWFDKYLERFLDGEKFSKDDFNVRPSYVDSPFTKVQHSTKARNRFAAAKEMSSVTSRSRLAIKNENFIDSKHILKHRKRFQSGSNLLTELKLNRRQRLHSNDNTKTGSSSMEPGTAVQNSGKDIFKRVDVLNTASKATRKQRHADDSELSVVEADLRDVPGEHWNCCTLGMLAGDKGFACVSQRYAHRILDRKANRAHNRRQAGVYFDNLVPTEEGERIMLLFSDCVTGSGASDFDNCCEISLTNYYARSERWNQFKQQIASSVH